MSGGWRCSSCACPGHPTPTYEDVPCRYPGDHREIYPCNWCNAEICICCYMKHIEEKHPELYGVKDESGTPRSDLAKRSKSRLGS